MIEAYLWLIRALSLDRCFSSVVTMAAERHSPPPKVQSSPTRPALSARQEEEEREKGETTKVADLPVSRVSEPHCSAPLVSPPRPRPAQICRVEAKLGSQRVEEKTEREARTEDVNVKPQKKPFWLEDDLPPIM